MTIGPVVVDLGGLLIDEDTQSGSGAVWVPTSLDGWWDTPDASLATSPVQPSGETITNARFNSRAISAEFVARHPVNGWALTPQQVFSAMQEIKFAISQGVVAPVLLRVTDPLLALESLVRLAQPLRSRIEGTAAALTVQVPLTCPDPRRYSQDQQIVALAAGSNTITNLGDMPTPVLLEASGTNPSWQNASAFGAPTLAVTGSGAVAVDTATEAVTIDGGGSRPALTTAQWWELVPGDNDIVASVGGSITFRSAYS